MPWTPVDLLGPAKVFHGREPTKGAFLTYAEPLDVVSVVSCRCSQLVGYSDSDYVADLYYRGSELVERFIVPMGLVFQGGVRPPNYA